MVTGQIQKPAEFNVVDALIEFAIEMGKGCFADESVVSTADGTLPVDQGLRAVIDFIVRAIFEKLVSVDVLIPMYYLYGQRLPLLGKLIRSSES